MLGAGRRVAIVGCGQIADAHIAQARRAGADVVAVADASPHVAEQAAARFGVPAWFGRVDELLDRARPDVVHVTTPPATHLALARAALAAGAHVYVEKPFTVDAAEADELAAAARAARRLVCAGHNHLYDPVVRRLRALVDAGRLGDVVHVEAVMSYDLSGPFGALLMSDPGHWVHRLPGGLAQNNLSHPLSLVQPFLGSGTPSVSALGRRRRPERHGDARDAFHDEVRALLDGPSATATVAFSCRIRPMQLALSVYGTRRTALVSIDARTLRLVEGSKLPGPFQKVDWARADAVSAARELLRHGRDVALARLHYFEGMKDLFAAFYAATAGEADPPIATADVLVTARIMDRIVEACRGADAPAQELAS